MALLDRFRRPSVLRAPAEHRALVAAGRRIDLNLRKEVESLVQRRNTWQKDAWSYWHSVGPLKYVTNFKGNVLARAKFFPAWATPDSDVPVPLEDADGVPAGLVEAAGDSMARLGDLPPIIRRFTVCWDVPGEGFLVGYVEDGTETFEVVSRSQLHKHNGRDAIEVRYSSTDRGGREINPQRDFFARLWQEDAEWPAMADSPMRSVLFEVEELLILNRHVRAVGRSRIANGNLLTLPQELSILPDDYASPDGSPGLQVHSYANDIQRAFIEPIHDEGSASAVSPILVEGPHKYLDGIRYIEMPRTIDATIDSRTEKLYVTLARAMNTPPERLLGLQGTTFANASQVERSEWDAHIAPTGEAIGLSLAKAYLRPELAERGFSPADLRNLTIAVDPARAVSNPSLASDAKDAAKLGVIGSEATRRALGFDDADAPTDDDRALWMAMNKGTVDAGLTTELLNKVLDLALGERERIVVAPASSPAPPAPPLRRPTPAGQDQVPREPVAASAAPERGEQTGRRLGEIDAALLARVVVAADAAMGRALERAGAKLRSAVQTNKALAAQVNGTPASDVGLVLGRGVLTQFGVEEDALLADAFGGFVGQYEAWVAAAQGEAAVVAAGLAGWDETRRAQIEAQQADDRHESGLLLLAALLGLARLRLFQRETAPEVGEHDPSLSVPTGVIRPALTRAGGIPRPDPWPGEVATGRTILGGLADDGFGVTFWVWSYGAFPRVPFEPHLALSGVRFDRWDSPVLMNTSGWPRVTHYRPGDHAGCGCAAWPVLTEVT